MISGTTTLIAHIGYPTDSFKAPLIYNPWFEHAGIDAAVIPMGVTADDYTHVLKPLFRIRNLRGALVTMPHKVTTVALLDDCSTAVDIAGSCNAILKRPDGTLLGEFDRCIDLAEHRKYLDTQPSRPIPEGVEVLGPWMPFGGPASDWLNAKALPYNFDSRMPDTFFAKTAADYLRQPRKRPFFLSVGFYVTHSPFRFPIEFRDLFSPDEFQPPEVGNEDRDRIPPVFLDLTDREKRGIIAAYHTSAAYMDRNVGLILDSLKRARLAENTLVIFNSDHGYMLGEHGRFEKHCCFEEAVRSALVLRLPGVIAPGRSSTSLIELIDVVPTVLHLCGLEVPADVEGRSLAPLLRGETDRHRSHVISEYADNAEAMVRTDRWKLIHCAGNRRSRDGYALDDSPSRPTTRLYDLAADPSEMRDVSGVAEHREVVEGLLKVLADHMKRTTPDPGSLTDKDDPLFILERCLPPVGTRYRRGP